jgi:uncharacterized protein YndB with AHSA1/START domain
MTTTTAVPTQVYRIYIKASAQAIWDAITKPEWTSRYGYRGLADYDLRPGGAFRSCWSEELQRSHGVPEVAVDGEVIEADAPHKLVHTWRMAMNPELADEGFTRVTYEIVEGDGGMSKLTVTHELDSAPKSAALYAGEQEGDGAGGGWSWVLSDLKTLLESGTAMSG